MTKYFFLMGCCLLSLMFFTTACNSDGDDPAPDTTTNVTPPEAVDTTANETEPEADSATMTQHTYASSEISGYWLYKPKNVTDNMPLIVYLHGGSGRGSDLSLVVSGSLPLFLNNGSVKDIPAYILMPQCPSNKTWDQLGESLFKLINDIVTDKKINSEKISLTGHSLGGTGTWSLGAVYFPLLSCIAPLSGSVNTNNASSYTSIPVWAFVGSADTIVDPSSSENIVPKINAQGGTAQIKVYDGATHFDIPDLVYKDQSVNLLNWMISQEL